MERGAFGDVKFRKLEERIHVVPYHRRRRAAVLA
jgi:hypothetical protein